MNENLLDISSLLTWEEDLPRPQWEVIQEWIEAHCQPETAREAWNDAARQWLSQLDDALGGHYTVVESDHFLALVPESGTHGSGILPFAERCRTKLLDSLGGVTSFELSGKQVVIVLRNPADYYHYISLYYGEGEHGGSAGVHLRTGYPHVALHGKEVWSWESNC
jgi:hypothetical protein